MSFSLYGTLPPSKTGKDSEKSESNTTTTTPTATNISGLYSSLPAPDSRSTTFQKDANETTPVVETPPAPAPAPVQPTGIEIAIHVYFLSDSPWLFFLSRLVCI